MELYDISADGKTFSTQWLTEYEACDLGSRGLYVRNKKSGNVIEGYGFLNIPDGLAEFE